MPTTYAIPDGRTVMAATLYTGTGATQSIVNAVNGVSFQPDLVWVKNRATTDFHILQDSVRGTGKELFSNSTGAEESYANSLTSFNSNGFTLGSRLPPNNTGSAYVGWQWNAGGSTVTNTSGTISAQVRANPTAGFSVVTYTGNGTSGATVGHGLGVAPSMVIVKQRTDSGTYWNSYHISIGNGSAIDLNTTSAASASSFYWNNTSPTSSVFSISTNGTGYTNVSGKNYVAYCFAAVAGYSAFGSYTGNGSTDGPFVYLGFRPRYLLIKNISASEGWEIMDTSRNTYNAVNSLLEANQANAEVTSTSRDTDYLSNGFKVRNTSTAMNTNGSTYIYAAFAENPFKYANAR